MKLAILNDIHLNFLKHPGASRAFGVYVREQDAPDAVVVAGDIAECATVLRIGKNQTSDPPTSVPAQPGVAPRPLRSEPELPGQQADAAETCGQSFRFRAALRSRSI